MMGSGQADGPQRVHKDPEVAGLSEVEVGYCREAAAIEAAAAVW